MGEWEVLFDSVRSNFVPCIGLLRWLFWMLYNLICLLHSFIWGTLTWYLSSKTTRGRLPWWRSYPWHSWTLSRTGWSESVSLSLSLSLSLSFSLSLSLSPLLLILQHFWYNYCTPFLSFLSTLPTVLVTSSTLREYRAWIGLKSWRPLTMIPRASSTRAGGASSIQRVT